MQVVIDIEANGRENPDRIWVIVCKDIKTNKLYIFREDTLDDFRIFSKRVRLWIGHNILGYDLGVIARLVGISISSEHTFDTLIASKFLNYSVDGHSIEDYGERYGIVKSAFSDYSKYSQELEDRCVRDVEITHHIYRNLSPHVGSHNLNAFQSEQSFQYGPVNDLHNNGFAFNVSKAKSLLDKVTRELSELDEKIHEHFPIRLKLIREVHPVLTKHDTLHRKDFRWVKDGDLSEYNGGSFCRCTWVKFNASSHKQVVDVLSQAGWKPTERTQTYVDKQRERLRNRRNGLDIGTELCDDEQSKEKYSWKINETNLSTLPSSAPAPAKSLARRILIESRRRTLTEWLALVGSDQRIHGKFYSIGAWTHRMAHQAPNTANIPNPTDTQGKPRPYGAEMRALWCAPRNRLLVGVDAEGIQLRIFAHYIDDPEFTKALVEGKKDAKTDPHSLNQKVLGTVCKSRAAAKRFIYALLLGAGIGKLSQVLECSETETRMALERLLERYTGFAKLKNTIIPRDAERGWFEGLDGRRVKIFGNTEYERKHLAMSGYLQNGEIVIMKHATLLWYEVLKRLEIEFKLVNFVHDEWQTECSNNMAVALQIAQIQCDALREVGERLGLKCPLAGSYWNEDLKDYTIGTNWKVTH
jgi:DNA polymerase I